MQAALLRRKIAAAAASAPPAERAATAFAAAVADLFGAEWLTGAVEVRAVAATDISKLIEDATCFAFEGESGAGFVALDKTAVIAAADKAIGRSCDPDDAEPTHVDRMLAAGSAQRLFSLALDIQDTPSTTLRLLAIGDAEDAASKLSGAIFVYRFAVAAANSDRAASIAIAAPAAAAALMPAGAAAARQFGERAARSAKTSLRVEVGVVAANLQRVMALTEGDVLPIEMLAKAHLTNGDGSRLLLTGKVGERDGARALRILASDRQ
jgi:hypothetical protein